MKPPFYKDTVEVDGICIVIRSLRPPDCEVEQQFVRRLSDSKRFYNFHSTFLELGTAVLQRLTRVNYPNEMALVAIAYFDVKRQEEVQLGIAQYSRIPHSDTAEVSLVMADGVEMRGEVGMRLFLDLKDLARKEGITHFVISLLLEDTETLKFTRSIGFVEKDRFYHDSEVELELDLCERHEIERR